MAHSPAAEDKMSQKKKWTLEAAVAVLTIFGALLMGGRYLLTPWFATAATQTMASEIDRRIDTKVAPINAAVISQLQDKVDELTLKIDLLEAKKNRSAVEFTDDDVKELNALRNRLSKQKAALDEMKKTKPAP